MFNSTVSTPVLAQNSINAIKEPFRKTMIEASDKSVDHRDPAKTADVIFHEPDHVVLALSSTLLPPFNPSEITDRELLKLCQQYGGNSRAWKRKFEELLPEVLKRHLYKGRKFTSIYEFSAKLCGLSKDSVDNVIRVYGQLENMPILRSLVVEFGWSKLRIVSGIATPETDASWAEKVRVLPKDSLEVFVRDLKRQEEREKIENGQASEQPNNQDKNTTITLSLSTEQDKLTDQQSLPHHQFLIRPIFPRENLQFTENHGQTNICLPVQFGRLNLITVAGDHRENSWTAISFKVDPEVDFRLRKLKSRIEKGKKEKISFNQLFETMLDIIENKERIVKKSRNPYGMTPLRLSRR